MNVSYVQIAKLVPKWAIAHYRLDVQGTELDSSMKLVSSHAASSTKNFLRNQNLEPLVVPVYIL